MHFWSMGGASGPSGGALRARRVPGAILGSLWAPFGVAFGGLGSTWDHLLATLDVFFALLFAGLFLERFLSTFGVHFEVPGHLKPSMLIQSGGNFTEIRRCEKVSKKR